MQPTALLLVLLWATAESLTIRRYDLISSARNWTMAQGHCRKHYTDLAFIDSEMDDEDLARASVERPRLAWIGLHRVPKPSAWEWSGGRSVTYTNWASEKPEGNDDQDKVLTRASGEWNNRKKSVLIPFYCYSLCVVEEEAKAWEEALKHCRRRGSDLMSLRYHTSLSRSDLREQLEKIQSQRVWIGLRFLGDRWLWVNGYSWMRPAWTAGGEDHRCPLWNRCGALTKEGLWENWDCQEKLPFICD